MYLNPSHVLFAHNRTHSQGKRTNEPCVPPLPYFNTPKGGLLKRISTARKNASHQSRNKCAHLITVLGCARPPSLRHPERQSQPSRSLPSIPCVKFTAPFKCHRTFSSRQGPVPAISPQDNRHFARSPMNDEEKICREKANKTPEGSRLEFGREVTTRVGGEVGVGTVRE
jgi:hypothetical protein